MFIIKFSCPDGCEKYLKNREETHLIKFKTRQEAEKEIEGFKEQEKMIHEKLYSPLPEVAKKFLAESFHIHTYDIEECNDKIIEFKHYKRG